MDREFPRAQAWNISHIRSTGCHDTSRASPVARDRADVELVDIPGTQLHIQPPIAQVPRATRDTRAAQIVSTDSRSSVPPHPKFQPPRFARYLAAVSQLDQLARDRFNRRVIQLAVRWMLDRGLSAALWGGGTRATRVRARRGGWKLDAAAMTRVNQILSSTITDPVGPELMAPLQRSNDESPRS